MMLRYRNTQLVALVCFAALGCSASTPEPADTPPPPTPAPPPPAQPARVSEFQRFSLPQSPQTYSPTHSQVAFAAWGAMAEADFSRKGRGHIRSCPLPTQDGSCSQWFLSDKPSLASWREIETPFAADNARLLSGMEYVYLFRSAGNTEIARFKPGMPRWEGMEYSSRVSQMYLHNSNSVAAVSDGVMMLAESWKSGIHVITAKFKPHGERYALPFKGPKLRGFDEKSLKHGCVAKRIPIALASRFAEKGGKLLPDARFFWGEQLRGLPRCKRQIEKAGGPMATYSGNLSPRGRISDKRLVPQEIADNPDKWAGKPITSRPGLLRLAGKSFTENMRPRSAAPPPVGDARFKKKVQTLSEVVRAGMYSPRLGRGLALVEVGAERFGQAFDHEGRSSAAPQKLAKELKGTRKLKFFAIGEHWYALRTSKFAKDYVVPLLAGAPKLALPAAPKKGRRRRIVLLKDGGVRIFAFGSRATQLWHLDISPAGAPGEWKEVDGWQKERERYERGYGNAEILDIQDGNAIAVVRLNYSRKLLVPLNGTKPDWKGAKVLSHVSDSFMSAKLWKSTVLVHRAWSGNTVFWLPSWTRLPLRPWIGRHSFSRLGAGLDVSGQVALTAAPGAPRVIGGDLEPLKKGHCPAAFATGPDMIVALCDKPDKATKASHAGAYLIHVDGKPSAEALGGTPTKQHQ